MTSRIITASTTTPLWTSLESALRHTLRAMAEPVPAAADMAHAQDRLRRDSRHWLLG